MNATLQKTITEMMADTHKLEVLLLRERDVLLGPHTENAANLATEKERVIERIQTMLTELNNKLSEEDKLNPAVTGLTELLIQCKSINSENNALVNQRLKIVRQSLAVVRTAVDNNSVELYSDQGTPMRSAAQRNLTSV